MALGIPFQKGHDPRRNLAGGGPGPAKTIRTLAKQQRDETVRRLQELRDQTEDLRIALEASKVLAAYADGTPREGKADDGEDEAKAEKVDATTLKLLSPPTPETPEGGA
jgi:hypothetical protein